MSRIIAGVLAGAVALALPFAAEAAAKKKKYPKRHAKVVSESYGQGGSTARQRANSRAYERGEYYEQLPDAHVFGSRSWWYLKEREMGNSRN